MTTEIEYGANYPDLIEPGSPRTVRYYRDRYGKIDRDTAESMVRHVNAQIERSGIDMSGEEAYLICRTVSYGMPTRVAPNLDPTPWANGFGYKYPHNSTNVNYMDLDWSPDPGFEQDKSKYDG